MTGKKLSHSAEDCLQAYRDLEAKGPVTRDKFRKESGIPESTWEYHFGTFAELKRQAGATPTAAVKKLHTAIAKVTSVSHRESISTERKGYADKYIRTDDSRYKTMVIASDLHDKEIDPFYLRVFLDTCKRVQPDVVTLGGDVFDLPEFGKYTIDPREWDVVGRIKFTHDNIFGPLREACPDAQIDLIEGNHECVSEYTEVMTAQGWIPAGAYYDMGIKPPIASFCLSTHEITYNKPIAVERDNGRELFRVHSAFKDEIVTDNHSMIYDGDRVPLHILADDGAYLDGDRCTLALDTPPKHPIELDINLVRLAVWVMTHGVIRRTEREDRYWLSFKVPRRIERRIKAVVQNIDGIKWVKTAKGVEIEGPRLAEILEVITGQEDIPDYTRWLAVPDWFESLPAPYGYEVARELTWASTQAFMSKTTSYFNGYHHAAGEALQWFLVTHGVPCSIKYLDRGQYILVFNETGKMERWRGKRVKISDHGHGSVISIQTKDGTLITRYNGKINFTGNCRLVKHLADFSPATRAILGDLHGMTIGDLFGLGKYRINYVAKADLKSYTERDHKKELENNYRVYWDSVLVHHFPHARHMGLPGFNGHHHSHVVWPMYNIHRGAYEWHQLGAGHKRKASYCEGERWHNGFAIAHVDTLTKTVNIEYVPITSFAVVGGKFYTREASEIIT